MSVASVDRVFPLRLLGTVTLGAGLVLAAGLVEACAPLTAVALAAGGAAVVPAAALVSRGLAIHAAARSVRALRGTCRCAGMWGMGVLTAGLTAAALPLAGTAHRQLVATVGLTLAAALFAVGVLHVPGIAATAVARLRHGLDGLVIGVSLALVGWLVVPGIGADHRFGYVAAVVAASYAAVTGAALLRAPRQRAATSRCGTGAGLAIVGLALLVVLVEREVPQWALLAAAGLVVAGPPLVWAGARRVDLTPAAGRTSLDETFGGYPMLALPVGAAALAGGYHLVVAGLPDLTAALLTMALGGSLAVREVLAATDLRRYARRLVAQEAHLRALVAGAGDVTVVLGDDLVVRWVSPAAAYQFGLSVRDLVGRPLADRLHPDDLTAFADQLRLVTGAEATATRTGGPVLVEARLRDGAGRWRETESTISDLRTAPEVGALVVQVRDVGRRRDLERRLHRLTSTDQRTGLPNRREVLRAVAARRQAGRRAGALLVVELYGIAAVDDLRGRTVGDAVLAEATRRLRGQVGPDAVVGRLGESQFAVVTADGPIEAHALGVRLLAALTGQYHLPDRPVRLQASVGLTTLAGGASAEDVVRRGSLALRRAGQLGRNRVEWYDEGLEKQLVRRLDLERHLPGAVGRDELDLVYQPVVELAGGRPVGVEALLRWRHPVLGTVLPGELLPVADRLRLSEEIGEWVLHTACAQVAAWRRDGHDLWLALNVTARQVAAEAFVPEVAAALSIHQTPPERLVVEISDAEVGAADAAPAADDADSAPAADDADAAPAADDADRLPMLAGQLSRLRALGVRTALDDFGAGDTDLARLRRLPLDLVKLARPAGVGATGELARAVVDLTRRLGLAVVAEELETEAERELVRAAGCRYGQGNVVAPPAPAERIEAYLDSQRAPSR